MDDVGVSIDPVCGKPVVDHEAEAFEYKRRTYHFCSAGCRARFEQQAERMHIAELARMGALFAGTRASWGVA
jgi:YHS domain-containing protein